MRIEWKGCTAQIDHLLISRLLEIYVVESKSFRTKVRYANGGWERLNFSHWEGIPCPVAQNERHIAVLKDLIDDLGLAPKRFGMSIPVTLRNVVVVRPSCSIIGDFKGDARIWRMDTLVKQARGEGPSAVDLVRIISQETLSLFATKLTALHDAPGRIENSRAPRCEVCGATVEQKVVYFCRFNSKRFAGRLLCRACQPSASGVVPTAVPV